MIRCILFDRDGTLGELTDHRYPQTIVPFADIRAVFSKLQELGYIVGIITNQSSIARGTGVGYDFDAEFAAYGTDLWEICPHDTPDNCDCRKPKSGLLVKLCNRLQLSPEECLVVGDRLSDVLCAKNVHGNAALVLTGYGKNEKESVLAAFPDTPIFNQFDEVIPYLQSL